MTRPMNEEGGRRKTQRDQGSGFNSGDCKMQIAKCTLQIADSTTLTPYHSPRSLRDARRRGLWQMVFFIQHSLFPRWSVGTRLIVSFILHPSSFILFVILFLLSLVAAPVFAQDIQPPEIAGVRVGLADRFKVGLWAPMEITLRGGSQELHGAVAVTVPDGDGIPSRVATPPEMPCQVTPGRETKVLLNVRMGRVQGELKVDFIVDGQIAASKTMKSSGEIDKEHFLEPLEMQPLFVTVGSTKMGIDENPRLRERDLEHRPVEALLHDCGQLPACWYGYEAVNALVLSTSRPELYRMLTLHSEGLEALDQWIRMGGRLVLCVGDRAEEVLAKDSPLRRFAPGRLDKMISLRQTAVLEMYCGSTVAMPQVQGGDKAALRVPKLVDIQGVVEAREADLPLIIRTPRAFGQIIFIACDLDRAPLSNWPDRNLLLAKLLDLPMGPGEHPAESAALLHHGYIDLSGQLRSALDCYPGVYVIPFGLVASLIIFYILLIGPGDYFFLRKIVRHMQWTWLSFPLIVLAISGGACLLAYYLKGDQLRVNQLDLVDIDASSGFVRGTTWLNIFSPRTQFFQFSLQPRLPDGQPAANAQAWLAWLGLEGRALGGMNSRGANQRLWPEPYQFAPQLNALQGVPIQVWSMKSFTGRWTSSTAMFPRAELSEDGQSLFGSVSNTLGFSLRQCILAHGRWAYELGPLAAGETAIVDQTVKRSELRTLLTGKKMIFEEKYRQEITPYDQASTDVSYILKMMMFYNAIDGRSYTRLANGYQTFVDLSDLLKTGRAILLAEGPDQLPEKKCGAVLLCDNKPVDKPRDKHKTIYRFVFPVKSTQ